jgi:queuine/archaeosine tRNA-ribosyltransferase
MVKYESQDHWCNLCKKKVPFTFGARKLCSACHRTYHGNTKTLTEMEKTILQKEDEIANLQTIINLMQDMQQKIVQHTEKIATTE